MYIEHHKVGYNSKNFATTPYIYFFVAVELLIWFWWCPRWRPHFAYLAQLIALTGLSCGCCCSRPLFAFFVWLLCLKWHSAAAVVVAVSCVFVCFVTKAAILCCSELSQMAINNCSYLAASSTGRACACVCVCGAYLAKVNICLLSLAAIKCALCVSFMALACFCSFIYLFFVFFNAVCLIIIFNWYTHKLYVFCLGASLTLCSLTFFVCFLC